MIASLANQQTCDLRLTSICVVKENNVCNEAIYGGLGALQTTTYPHNHISIKEWE